MQASKEILTDLAYKYIDSGKSVIPVFGKRPINSNWSSFCEVLPTEEDLEAMSFSGATGIGLCLGKASGICCIDIDTNDTDLYYKVLDIIQVSASGKTGKKGATFFYRLPANIPAQKIQTVRFKNGDLVEFFFGGKQTLIPPSIHPDTKTAYTWLGESLTPDYDIEFLPVFDMSTIDAIQSLARSGDASTAKSALSPVMGRNSALQRQAAILISNRTELMLAVSHLVAYDKEHHGNNPLFTDTSEFKTNEPFLNALFFFSSQLRSINGRKKPGEYLELPSDLKYTVSKEALGEIKFGEIIPYGSVSPVSPFNNEWIPEVMRHWMINFSEATSQPVDAIFMSTLCTLSSLLGAKISILPTHNDKSWKEMANIYVMMIAASGGGKTLVEKIASAPLIAIEKRIDAKFEEGKANTDREISRSKILLKAVKGRYEKAVSDSGDNLEELEEEIRRLEKLVNPPKKKQYRSSNCTPEKLIEIIESSPYGHFHSADELGVLLKQYDKKGYELLKAIHLNLYNNGRFSYETKSSGSYVIDPCSLSILCSGQVSVYNEYVRNLTKEGAQDDGHLQRFIPVVNIGNSSSFNPDTKNNLEVPDSVQYIFNKADSSHSYEVISDDKANLEFLRIKKISIDNWQKYQQINENMLAGVESKKRGHIVRISFLLSFIKNNGDIKRIDTDSVLTAEKIVNNLYERLIYCYKSKKDKMPEMRREIMSLIEIGSIQNGIAYRDIMRLSSKFQMDKEAFRQCLSDLESTNRIKITKDRADSKKIYLNPEYVKEINS